MQTLGKSYWWLDCKVWDFPSLSLLLQFKMWPPTCCSPFSLVLGGLSCPWLGTCVWTCCVWAFQWQLKHWALFICFRKNMCLGASQIPKPQQGNLSCAGSPTHPPRLLGQAFTTISLVTHVLSWVLAPAQFLILPRNLQGLFLLLNLCHHWWGLGASCSGEAVWSRYQPSISQKTCALPWYN